MAKLIELVVLGGIAAVFMITWFNRRRRTVDIPETSVLLSYYTDGALVQPLVEGRNGDMQYSALLILNAAARTKGVLEDNALLYQVALPFESKIHLLGIPKKSGATQLDPTGSGLMEKVELEGDFDDYFSLFCEKGMQVDARYVLNPKVMAFVVDFCQSHNWEIVGNELYFLQETGTGAAGDHTDMFKDINAFVAQIRPVIEQPLTDAEKQAITPYGEDSRTDLKCPVCGQVLTNTGQYFACPKGDGALVNGRLLPELISKPERVSDPQDIPAISRMKPLVCPSCGATMQHVAYEFSKVIIDSCPNCPYRWLDAGEIKINFEK